jgi:hypothetical protein
MKQLYLLLACICLFQVTQAQLTVTATATTPTICAGNSTTLNASASPAGYTVTAIPTNPQALQGLNYLAQNGVDLGGLAIGNLDDGRWDGIALPFTFRFYGIDYSYINVSTNGWVGLGTTNSVTTGLNQVLPAASAPNAVIHAITADLNFKPATTSFIEYFEGGSYPNRTFAINYGNIKFFSGGGTADVQVILYESTNVIEIHTSDCSNTTLGKAQGVENATGTVASVVTGRNNTTNWTGTGFVNSYRFTPDNITFTWSPATGLSSTTGAIVTATPASTQTYTVNALNTNNSATGSNTVTVTVSAASYTLAATAGGPQVCQNISVAGGGTNYRDAGTCNLIATVVPSGASPVSNSINTCVKLDTGATKRGTTTLYGPRKYDIEPILSPATSTASITLYYPQSDFDNYNLKAVDSGKKKLPITSGDATGISNLVIRQFHGTGTAPGNYTGPAASQDFSTPTVGFSVVWNATRNWWEVTVPVTGFSGFYITTKANGTLGINLDYFKGVQVDKKNTLSWKVNCTSAKATFEVLRSGDGVHYSTIGTLTADQLRCSQPFDFTDDSPLGGSNFYRIRIIDTNGKDALSNIVQLSLKTTRYQMISLNPNLVHTENAILKINATEKNELNIVITDFSGRRISTETIPVQPGINQTVLHTSDLVNGTYQVTGYMQGEKPQTLRLVKQ